MFASFVCAFTFDLLTEDFERISREAAQFARSATPRIVGLIETTVLGNEERTRLLVLSRWESKAAWSRARWDEEAGKMLADLVQSTKTFNVQSFVPIAIELKTPPDR